MITISSRMTKFHKFVFPTIWFGFLTFFMIVPALTGDLLKQPIIAIMPILMGVFGFFLMKKMLWDLVDEVVDCGDHLVVKKGREEDTIALSNIMNVSASTFTNPPRITLRLVQPGKFGNEITFSPAGKTLNVFAKNAIAEDLIVRVHRARH